jgi:DNA-binding IclR family transcriptional regulator
MTTHEVQDASDLGELDGDRSVLGRAAMIINAFDNGKPTLSLNDLTTITGLPRSTVHRFAEQLIAIGWFERASAGYRVGTRLFEVGSRAERLNRIRVAANPWMFKLHEMSRMCVHLAILDGVEILYLDKIAARGINLPSLIGHRMPAHCTALGRVMLAHSSDIEIERVLYEGLEPRTPYTAATPEMFRSKLDDVLESGVAVDFEETVPGMLCVAAPIRGAGRALAAVSITGPRDGFDLKRLSAAVRMAANGIWTDLFGTIQPDAERPLRDPVPVQMHAASAFDPWAMQIQLGEWF